MKYFIIGLIIVGVIFVLLTLKFAHEFVQIHGPHNIVGRIIMGRRADGKRHTNASFWRASDGKVTGHPVGRIGKRGHRAGIFNLLRTLAWVTAIILFIYGFFNAEGLTIALAITAASIGLIWKAVLLVIKARQLYLHRTYITPLAAAMAPIIGMTGPELEQNIHMKRDYMTIKNGELGRIYLPPRHRSGPDNEDSQLETLISSRLPVPVETTWKMKGKTPHIVLKASPPMPTMARFSDYIPEIEALGKRKYIAGVDRAGKPYVAHFDGENPHHGMCWGTARGKTSQLMSIIAQIFHNDPDATGTIIDPKELSLDAMLGVPGLEFFNDADDIPGMWAGIEGVHAMMRERYVQLKADPSTEFPAHLLIMEECNSFAIMSKIVWQRNRKSGQPATPPIWADCIAPIFWRARQVNIFVVLVAQSIQERFLGGLNLRPSLGLISLAGYKMSQWDTYVGTSPRPKPQKGQGRAIYVDGDQETWIQALFDDPGKLKDYAMANRSPNVIKGNNLIIPDTDTVDAINQGRV
jgi:hypothetical protein